MRKKNEWRYLVVLLILLALAMLGSRTQAESLAAQREQDSLARGLQLKTTVSLDWDGAPFADEETGGMLRDVLENSWFVLLHETPEDGGTVVGHTATYLTVRTVTDQPAGSLVCVTVTGVEGETLCGIEAAGA